MADKTGKTTGKAGTKSGKAGTKGGKKKKWLWTAILGGAVILLYLYKKMTAASTTTSTSASVLPLGYNTPSTSYGGASSGSSSTTGSNYAAQTATALSALEAQIQGLQNANTIVPTTSGSASNLGTGTNTPLQLLGRYNVGGSGTANFTTAVAAARASGSPLVDTRTNKTLTATNNPVFYVEGKYNQAAGSNFVNATSSLAAAKTLAQTTAKKQAGQGISVLNNQGNQVAYAIAKAGQNGKLTTGSSYNADVNANHGQYIANTWFAGAYNQAGKFATTNTKQQAKYNTLTHKGA